MRHDRRGFTLVELLIVTVLGSLVVLSALQILITNQRTYTAQSAVITGQQSNRMALEVLFNELREISPSGGDIEGMSSNAVRVRLMRKFSIVCEVDLSGGNPEITVLKLPGRRFESSDSVFLFADNDPYDDDDDVWIQAQVTNVDTTTTCPQPTLNPAQTLRFNGQMALFTADSVGVGAPIRSFDRYAFGLTDYLGDPYLGRRQGTGAMVPMVGPLRSSGNGLEFVFRDAMGDVTTNAADVRQIVVTVRTGSGVLNSLDREVQDSITAWIYTRN